MNPQVTGSCRGVSSSLPAFASPHDNLAVANHSTLFLAVSPCDSVINSKFVKDCCSNSVFVHTDRCVCVQFVYVQLLQRKVLLDLTAVTWYKNRLTQAIFVACFLAFALFVGTWFDTNGPTRGSTAAAFAACSSLAMVVLKQKNYLQQERYLVPLNFIMQASSTDGDSLC